MIHVSTIVEEVDNFDGFYLAKAILRDLGNVLITVIDLLSIAD